MANTKMLLVEGGDDEHVLKHICGNRGIPHLDEVKQLGGDRELLSTIPVQLKASNEEGDVVGVVMDADTNVSARWQSVRHRFLEAGYPEVMVPDQPDPNGTVLESPIGTLLPRAGIWIMPDNTTTGILEDFLAFLVPQPDLLFTHAITSVDSIPDKRFSNLDKPKAVMHTWLAWQKEPGQPYGTAITSRFLDASLPQADLLVAWLKRLFFLPQDLR